MKRLLIMAFTLLHLPQLSVAQEKVQSSRVNAVLKMEEVISGYLTELNGKFKLRVTEVTFAPGAQLGVHHHAGPGMRLVIAGELTFVQAGKETVYKTGEYFYESGNVAHTAHNRTSTPVRVAFFEVLPMAWSGPSTIPPKAY